MDALSWREARRLDLNAQELGVPVAKLMQRAGRALAKEVDGVAKDRPVLFFCGKGNNGGDGLAAAAHLQAQGKPAWVVLVEEPKAPGRGFLAGIDPKTITPWTGAAERAWAKVPVLVDCLLGSGLTGPPRAPYDDVMAYINRRHAGGATVIACDLPSGLGTSIGVKPDRTVTFHAPKQGMNKENSGRIVVVPIGIPHAAQTDVGLGDLATFFPVPRPDSHKGDNGNLLVVAGGPFTGAPYYVGMAAYRTGVDLVHACMPRQAARTVAAYGPEIMVHDIGPGTNLAASGAKEVRPWMEHATAMVIGPGLGHDAGTRKAVARILEHAADQDLPVVVDADGLDALTPDLLKRHGHRMVLTPHSKEFLDLTGTAPTDRTVPAYAKANGVTVVWKHQGALVTDGRTTRHCRRGHPTMTVGGTGDVLAGSIGALLAKGAPPFEAACAGAYLVGCAGEVAAGLRSWGATATDVAEAIPAVLLRIA